MKNQVFIGRQKNKKLKRLLKFTEERETLESIYEELFKQGTLSRNNKKFSPYEMSRMLYSTIE